MKKCPFCAEEIQDEAIKCKHCGEFLDLPAPAMTNTKPKWCFSATAIILGLATIGPFALPLVWKHPTYKVETKIAITIAVTAITIGLCYLLGLMFYLFIKSILDLGLHV